MLCPMSFYTQLNSLIVQCKNYLKYAAANDMLEDLQTQQMYTKLQQLCNIYEANKTNLKYSQPSASSPQNDGLNHARDQYDILLSCIPPFLAQDFKTYYYLQEYKILSSNLIIVFNQSAFEKDWPKMRNLIRWYNAIIKDQEALDSKGSLLQSLKDIRALGDFDSLSAKELQQLQEEVGNIQAILQNDSSLETELNVDDATLLRAALVFMDENNIVLNKLTPPIDKNTAPSNSCIERIALRSTHLGYLVTDFAEDYDKKTKVTALTEFKDQLRGHFDQQQTICVDIYQAILKEIGSFKKPSLNRLCRMLLNALSLFGDQELLAQRYSEEILKNCSNIEKGIPTVIELERLLKASIHTKI